MTKAPKPASRPTKDAEPPAEAASAPGAEAAPTPDMAAKVEPPPPAPAEDKGATVADPPKETPPERRAATVASRIEHDGEVYQPEDVVFLTLPEFLPLAKAGALVERDWDDCLADD